MLKQSFEELLYQYRKQVSILLIGLSFIGLGFIYSNSSLGEESEIEIISQDKSADNEERMLIVEVAGSVIDPGVYEFDDQSRIDDAIKKAGGLSPEADKDWVDRTLNKAAKLSDGLKIYIPSVDEQTPSTTANNFGTSSDTSSVIGASTQATININTASQKELESLWGIGPVTAQNIIEQRPYSSVEELLNRKILKSNVYERNKNLLSVY